MENISRSHTAAVFCPRPWTQQAFCACICERPDLAIPPFWGHEETKERKPQRRRAVVGAAGASPALLAMPGALHTIPRSGRFQDCEHVSAGKPRAFPLAPAAGERSIRAQPRPTPGGTWRSVCERRGPTSPSRCRLRLHPEDGSGWQINSQALCCCSSTLGLLSE